MVKTFPNNLLPRRRRTAPNPTAWGHEMNRILSAIDHDGTIKPEFLAQSNRRLRAERCDYCRVPYRGDESQTCRQCGAPLSTRSISDDLPPPGPSNIVRR